LETETALGCWSYEAKAERRKQFKMKRSNTHRCKLTAVLFARTALRQMPLEGLVGIEQIFQQPFTEDGLCRHVPLFLFKK
jgi:hypothetical protein